MRILLVTGWVIHAAFSLTCLIYERLSNVPSCRVSISVPADMMLTVHYSYDSGERSINEHEDSSKTAPCSGDWDQHHGHLVQFHDGCYKN